MFKPRNPFVCNLLSIFYRIFSNFTPKMVKNLIFNHLWEGGVVAGTSSWAPIATKTWLWPPVMYSIYIRWYICALKHFIPIPTILVNRLLRGYKGYSGGYIGHSEGRWGTQGGIRATQRGYMDHSRGYMGHSGGYMGHSGGWRGHSGGWRGYSGGFRDHSGG